MLLLVGDSMIFLSVMHEHFKRTYLRVPDTNTAISHKNEIYFMYSAF